MLEVSKVSEVSEVMRYVFSLCALGCGGWDLFAGGVGVAEGAEGTGGDALCATLYAGGAGGDALCATLFAGGV